ncbi:hypothetical protein D1970_05720 [Mesobacillus zeae]|uniref:Uncharacterized protein n=1 Tax=Mesobacillus zeae TaxID=1917180 RepID=A0A398BB19_9BACI|nr:hypothetical protein D1970_05720 [Mesobacillus zeae]
MAVAWFWLEIEITKRNNKAGAQFQLENETNTLESKAVLMGKIGKRKTENKRGALIMGFQYFLQSIL